MTIAELKQRLTYDEALIWQAYISKRGSLNVGRRIESSVGQLSYMFHAAHGGKRDFYTFAPHEKEPVSHDEALIKSTFAQATTRDGYKKSRAANRRYNRKNRNAGRRDGSGTEGGLREKQGDGEAGKATQSGV